MGGRSASEDEEANMMYTALSHRGGSGPESPERDRESGVENSIKSSSN